MRRCFLSLLVVAGALLAGCETTAVAPLTTGSRLEDDERRLWTQTKEEEAALLRSGFAAELPDTERYLNSLLLRLHAGSVAEGATLHAHVLADPSLNAFAMPNGAIFIHTGMLARLDNEAQLAAILAHELTHTVNRHGLKSYRSVKNHAAFISGVLVGTGGSLVGLLAGFGAVSSAMGYSQDLEREADSAGFQLLLAAGYDPRESVQVFRTLRDESLRLKKKEPFFFSSHPRLAERVANFEQFLAALPPERRAQGRTGADEFRAILPAVLNANAAAALTAGDLDFARDCAERCRGLRPTDARAIYYLAESFRRRGTDHNRDTALRLYREAVGGADAPAEANRGLGLELLRTGAKPAAADAFRRYLQLSPEARDRAHIEEFIRQCETQN